MNIKIAIIEDDIAIQLMYKMKLETQGYSVRCASNGREGFELCEDFLPNLILLDIRMPEVSGDKMLTKLRETSWGSNMRVIILTNLSKAEAPSELRLLRVDRYIVKAHYTPTQVLDIVHDVLGQAQIQAV